MLLKTYRPRRFFHHPLFIPFFHRNLPPLKTSHTLLPHPTPIHSFHSQHKSRYRRVVARYPANPAIQASCFAIMAACMKSGSNFQKRVHGSNDSCDYRVTVHVGHRGGVSISEGRCGPLFGILLTRDIRTIEISNEGGDWPLWILISQGGRSGEKEKLFNNNLERGS